MLLQSKNTGFKNKQEFEIKVELIDGDKSLFEKNKINQYYLIFL